MTRMGEEVVTRRGRIELGGEACGLLAALILGCGFLELMLHVSYWPHGTVR